jgi:hypothetical protein
MLRASTIRCFLNLFEGNIIIRRKYSPQEKPREEATKRAVNAWESNSPLNLLQQARNSSLFVFPITESGSGVSFK